MGGGHLLERGFYWKIYGISPQLVSVFRVFREISRFRDKMPPAPIDPQVILLFLNAAEFTDDNALIGSLMHDWILPANIPDDIMLEVFMYIGAFPITNQFCQARQARKKKLSVAPLKSDQLTHL